MLKATTQDFGEPGRAHPSALTSGHAPRRATQCRPQEHGVGNHVAIAGRLLEPPGVSRGRSLVLLFPNLSCGPFAGHRIADARHVLDHHGTSLTTALLLGDGWCAQYDAPEWRIFEDAKEMGTRCRVEVYDLLATCMPQDGRALAAGMPPRERQKEQKNDKGWCTCPSHFTRRLLA